MSAILSLPNSGPVPNRYRSRCKVLLDSHINKNGTTLVLMSEVIAVSTSKTIKGAGQASISLVPSQNWLNVFFPNDHVNIYFDIGDGTGWTRTFYGLVDRVEESYSVSEDGTPQSTYNVVCSDFGKMVERTQIYFNPNVVGREDFASNDFGRANIGGLALASAGVHVGGTPPGIVQNLLLTTYGFGSQFVLPPSYAPRSLQGLRSLRRSAALASAPQALRDKEASGELDAYINSIEDQLAEPGTTVEQRQTILSEAFTPEGTERGQVAGAFAASSYTILSSTTSQVAFLLDIVDIFSFVERESMDGMVAGTPVWQKTGSVLSLIKELSNEPINEMFFDLRPLSTADAAAVGLSSATVEDPDVYATAADDKGGNVEDGVYGITYSPSLVMREYPFSTVGYVNSSTYGHVYLGNIFCQGINVPGRKSVVAPNINVEDIASGRAAAPPRAGQYDRRLDDGGVLRKLDVAVISQKEIVSSTWGRSDDDHFNLFELRSDDLLGVAAPFYMKDFLPILTPIHIKRNGLRTHELRTVFARTAAPEQSQALEEHSTPAPTSEEQAGPSQEPIRSVVRVGDITPPAKGSDGVMFANRQPGRGDPSGQRNIPAWGYRRKVDYGDIWRMHHGVDIVLSARTGLRNWIKRVPAYAIADGEVVISAPEGVYNGYGDVVVIKHTFENRSTPIYSVYAHLSQRNVGWQLGQEAGTVRERPTYAATGAPGVQRADQTPIPIRKGTVVGLLGNTGLKKDSYRTTKNYRSIHLHFEIDTVFPPKSNITPDVDASVPLRPPVPASATRSINPVVFFREHGIDLTAAIMSTSTGNTDEGEQASPGDTEVGDEHSDADDNTPREDAGQPAAPVISPTTSSASISDGPIRRQVFRWSMLMDHWYQHNTEYLSGKVDMRGAPEIRVGYRLDILERNLSFYVEAVNHKWQYPDRLHTSLTVTRGQPNNPFPVFSVPKMADMGATDTQRKTDQSRLATAFETPDMYSTSRSLHLSPREFSIAKLDNGAFVDPSSINETDSIVLETDGTATEYDERVYEADVVRTPTLNADAVDTGSDVAVPTDDSIDLLSDPSIGGSYA